MDEYKVKNLQAMLMHETCESKTHYGAVLHHPELHTPHLTIDAGGLKALIAYYSEHNTDLGNNET